MPRLAASFSRYCSSLLVLLPMFLGMGLCYLSGEFYPLSSFPMYSKFDDRTYLVYLKSRDGKALPSVATVSMVSSQVKKRYGAELEDLKEFYSGSHFDWTADQKREAGKKTLRYLSETFAPQAFADGKLDGVRLIDVRVRMKDGKLETSEEEVGQFN